MVNPKKIIKGILIGGVIAIAVEIPSMLYWNHYTEFKETMQETGFDKPTVKQYTAYDGVKLDYIYEYKENEVTLDILERLNELQHMDDNDYRRLTYGSDNRPKGPEYLAFAENGLSTSEALMFYESGIKNPEDAKAIKEAQGIIFSTLEDIADQKIPMEKAIPLLKQGKTPDQIIIQYAEALGLTVEERRQYSRYGLKDDQIKTLVDHEIKPHMAGALIQPGWKVIFKQDELIQYVQEGKITKESMEAWNDIKIGWDDKAICIKTGYTAEETKKWVDNKFSVGTMNASILSGFSLEEMIRTRAMVNLIEAD